jgi:hypothetical protein
MQHADTLTVVHHDDTRTLYTDVRYALDRDGVRIRTLDGEVAFTDILTVHAYRRKAKVR